MNSFFKSAMAMIVALGLVACQSEMAQEAGVAKASDQVALDDQASKLGYSLGLQMGMGIKAQQLDEAINLDALKAAIDDVLAGNEPRLTPEEMQQAQLSYQQEQQAAYVAKAEKNQEEGVAFLAENGKVDGMTTTESGLQYQVLRDGKGDKPAATDTVKLHYQGTLVNGEKFDSSYDRGTPAEFPVGGVIPGFSEGLQLMQEGAKYKFFIPAAQAYGEDAPPSIGPNQVLIFEVELIEVLGKEDVS